MYKRQLLFREQGNTGERFADTVARLGFENVQEQLLSNQLLAVSYTHLDVYKRQKPLTPKQLQQRKKLMVYPLMGLLFLGSMWLIFAPSEKREVNRDTVGAFNADIPLPENDGIIGDKRKAYEQAQAERRQAEKVRSLEDFAFSEESDADGVEMELPDSEPEREPFRDYSGNGGGRSSIAAYRDINRKLGSFYEEPKVDGEKEELKRQVEEMCIRDSS